MSSPAIATHEQLGLVALSVAVAIVAGYLALDLAQRSAGATGAMRRAWIVAGGVTIGLGIWSMHFIGMVALKMAMPVSYDLPLVALSMIAAIGGSVVALDICWNATLVAFSLVIAFGASLAALFRRRRLPLRRQGRRPQPDRDHPGRRSRLAASIQLNKPRKAASAKQTTRIRGAR